MPVLRWIWLAAAETFCVCGFAGDEEKKWGQVQPGGEGRTQGTRSVRTLFP